MEGILVAYSKIGQRNVIAFAFLACNCQFRVIIRVIKIYPPFLFLSVTALTLNNFRRAGCYEKSLEVERIDPKTSLQ